MIAKRLSGSSVLLVMLAAAPLAGQEPTAAAGVEERAKLVRRGAGLAVGTWVVQDLPDVSQAEYSQWPAFGGYFQKGMDLHLAVVSSVGLWRRTQLREESSLGGTRRDEIATYIVPLFTALKFYPTRPENPAEPYVQAGIGFGLGIDDRQSSGAGGLGFGFSSGTVLVAGFGFGAEGGVELRLGNTFGLRAGGGYQWIRFGEDVGGARTYKGFQAYGGLSYRFQYQ